MSILYLLEKIRNPVLDVVMSLVTKLGEETLFIVLAIVVFWCIDKKGGYFLICIGFLGTILNQFLKVLFRVPRPWVKDPNFTIVESAKEAATGYSFPSGHTQSAVGSFGAIALFFKKKWVRILSIIVIILVPISRMYLGVHTLLDVGVSFIISLALVFAIYPLINKSDEKPYIIPIIMAVGTLIGVVGILFMKLYNFPQNTDMENVNHGIESMGKLIGATLGVFIACIVERKYINFETTASLPVQIVKIAGGLGITVLIKSLLKTPLNLLLGGALGNLVRYFLIIVFAVIVWPLVFKPLNNLYDKILVKIKNKNNA